MAKAKVNIEDVERFSGTSGGASATSYGTSGAALGIIPLIDAGENDYVSYNKQENVFCRFNIAEELEYAKKNTISECFAL